MDEFIEALHELSTQLLEDSEQLEDALGANTGIEEIQRRLGAICKTL